MRAGAWLARATIALGVAVGMALAIRDGVATELARSDPSSAARLLPSDARLALSAARAEVDGGAAPGDPVVRVLVDRALARDVTLPALVELRGLRAETAGDKGRAAALFSLSDQISRRSLGTRIWLIQRSVEAGDVGGALKDFDIALRTSSAAPPMLFPVLASAVSDPQLVGPIARLLDRPSDWRAMFLHHAVVERHAPPGVSSLVLQVRDRAALTRAGIDQTLIGELVGQAAFAEARRVHDAFHPALAAFVADPIFALPEQAYPFGWRLIESGELGATRGVVGGRPALTYQALSGAGGVVATQLLTLPAGGYRLTVRTAAADRAPSPYWTLTCGEAGGAQILRLDQPGQADGVGVGAFTVPAGCAGQWLALHVRGADTPSQSGAVASVQVSEP
jgi:hypothetical protein